MVDEYDAVRDEVYDDFVDEVVSEAGSMVEELPLTTGESNERLSAARPQSRISSVSPHFCPSLFYGLPQPLEVGDAKITTDDSFDNISFLRATDESLGGGRL